MLGDDRIVDLFGADRGKRDRYIDDCPAWCVEDHTQAPTNDDDRNHWGAYYAAPIRSITADYEPGDKDGVGTGCILGRAQLYLRRNVLHRDPTIWLGKGETDGGFDLTPAEAIELGHLLVRLGESA
jgi:hypothetical protein